MLIVDISTQVVMVQRGGECLIKKETTSRITLKWGKNFEC